MSEQGFEWRGHWDEYGARVDDDKVVSIRVGVIEVDGHLSLAISVAAAPPVTITGRVAAGLGELMQWAQDEHKMLVEQSRAAAGRPPAEVVDVNQAVAWLDDIDVQLSDIATDVRALRRRFPSPPDDADTGASADDENQDG